MLASIATAILLWIGWTTVGTFAPPWLQFSTAWLFLVLGPGLMGARAIGVGTDTLERFVLPWAAGVVASPLTAHLLWTVHLERAFPFIAAALGGAALGWRRSTQPAAPPPSRTTWLALGAVVAVALCAGAIAYAHRLEVSPAGIRVFGDYDTYDSGYYAAMSAELAREVPPRSPFYAGHALNYSWYPQLLLAMIHRFGGVTLFDEYLRYAWPAFLVTLAMTSFVAVRRMSNTRVALLATVLVLLGSDLSYIVAFFFERGQYWDDLVWSTNWMTPGAEVLYYNPWTPALAVLFLVFWTMARYEEARSRALLVTSCVLVGALMMYKPFGFAVILSAVFATALFSGPDRTTRRTFLLLFAGSIAFALPFVVTALRLYADSQSAVRLGFAYGTVLPTVAMRQLSLERPVHALTEALGGGRAITAAAPVVIANVLFFSGGLGVRVVGVPAVWRALRMRDAERPIWRLLAWTVLVGAVTPLVLVTDPYHQSFMFYQASLFVLWIFAARAALDDEAHRGRRHLLTAALIVVLATPSTLHYLDVKWHDHRHPFWLFSRDGGAVADALRQQDVRTTVVLHRFPGGASIWPLVTERRVLLAWSPYARDSAGLAAEIDDFFHRPSNDPRRGWLMLRRYHVTHVIETNGDRIHPGILHHLAPVVVTHDYRLYAVPPQTESLDAELESLRQAS